MIKNDRLSRLLLELPWLIQNKNTSIDIFCTQFNISRDEAIKDLSLLTYVGPGRFGGELVDIQYDDDNISVIDSQGFDRPLKLNNIEAVLLLLGVKNLGEMSKDKHELIDVETKLTKLIESDDANENRHKEYSLKRDLVKEAISNGNQLRIHYVDSSLKLTTERLITPVEITGLDAKEYLTAIDINSNQRKSFRIDRIVKVVEIPIKSTKTEQPLIEAVVEKIILRTKSWNASNILDMNIPFSISGDEMIIEMNLLDSDYLLEIILRLDRNIQITCSNETKDRLSKLLDNRIKSIL
jgi:proteasome accessory factor C